jgi:4-diphosphocytidyl-2-C-methyl-D-erythritol kinase
MKDRRGRTSCGVAASDSQRDKIFACAFSYRSVALPALLINPRVSVATKDVFAALRAGPVAQHTTSAPADAGWSGGDRQALIALVARQGNDLEPPAIFLHPAIAHVLAALRALAGCRLARMSGSGASCFGLFDSGRAAVAAARALRVAHPQWWIRPTVLGS